MLYVLMVSSFYSPYHLFNDWSSQTYPKRTIMFYHESFTIFNKLIILNKLMLHNKTIYAIK